MISENEFERLHAECERLRQENKGLLEVLNKERFQWDVLRMGYEFVCNDRDRYWRAAFGMMWLAIGLVIEAYRADESEYCAYCARKFHEEHRVICPVNRLHWAMEVYS